MRPTAPSLPGTPSGTRSAHITCSEPNGHWSVPNGDSLGRLGVWEQRFMKHPASRRLYAYWDELRGKRPAPERAEIEPGAIRQILSEAFIAALNPVAGYPFRLAGTRVCALFCRELKGESFLSLWDEASKRSIRDLFGI